jgi:hypothetical protein
VAVLAILAGAAICACGASPSDPVVTEPLTFTATVPVPTTAIPTPTSTPYPGPDVIPIETGQFLARPTTTPLGNVVDGIQCNELEQLAYRTNAHLQVYVDGQSRALPGGIGLVDPTFSDTSRGFFWTASACYYWLHTRAADGVIEVDSPTPRHYTLGDFFAIWNQPLSRHAVAGAVGRVSVIVDGHRFHGSPASVPIREHEQIELAVGKPVPRYQPIDWEASPF